MHTCIFPKLNIIFVIKIREQDTSSLLLPRCTNLKPSYSTTWTRSRAPSKLGKNWRERKKKKEITHEITKCLHVSSSPPINTRILSYKIMEINSRVLLLVAVARLRRRRRLLRLLLRVRMMMMMHHVVVIVVVIVVHVHLVRVAVGRRARRDLTRQSVQRLKHFHRSPPGGRISVPPSLGLVHPWGTQDYSSFPVSTEPQQPPNSNRLRVSNSHAPSLARTFTLSLSITRATHELDIARKIHDQWIYIYIYFLLPSFPSRSLIRSLSLSPSLHEYWTQKVYTVHETRMNRHQFVSREILFDVTIAHSGHG